MKNALLSTFFVALFGSLSILYIGWQQMPAHGPGTSSGRTPSAIEIPDQFFVQDLDKDLGEQFEDNDFSKEKKYITNVVGTFMKFIVDAKTSNSSDKTFRGAHAKALSCLKGEFIVNNQNLPENLRVGLFAKNETYKTWIRFSNSHQDPSTKDDDQNTRGFVMKLFGVGGEKILNSAGNSETLDLLMVAAEAFVARDNFNYSAIADGTETAIGLAWRLGWTRTRDLLSSVSKVKGEMNPLRLDYFSTVPYRLGPAGGPKKAIKFRTVLCDPKLGNQFVAEKSGPDNLEKNIIGTLDKVDAVCYNFQIQMADASTKVEDATTKWNTPYQTVAQVRIPKAQNAPSDIPARKEFCEHLSFNPWRTTDEHRPLGRINRARKTTYLMSSQARRSANRAAETEPDAQSFDQVR